MALKKAKPPKAINAFTARTHLGRLIKQVSEKGETYVLTKKGKPKVVMVGIREYAPVTPPFALLSSKRFENDFEDLPRKVQAQEDFSARRTAPQGSLSKSLSIRPLTHPSPQRGVGMPQDCLTARQNTAWNLLRASWCAECGVPDVRLKTGQARSSARTAARG